MNGIIIASAFSKYTVHHNQKTYICRIPKTLKNRRSPLIGDHVIFNPDDLMITELLPRKHVLPRPRLANLDQLFIVMSVAEPDFSLALVLRYATLAVRLLLPYSVIISKSDMTTNQVMVNRYINNLESLGIKVFVVSTKTNEGINELSDYLKGKISAFAGQTGVGKSSIINVIAPDYKRRIGEYSRALGRGKHETKEIVLLPFNEGYIADTPGFSSLDLKMRQMDAAENFPGFEQYSLKCKFVNCLHLDERGCAVTNALNHGKISKEVYEIYVQLIASLPRYKEHD
jgi:ribosome biogenesis GTPase / thiamine phosphate phosphatase